MSFVLGVACSAGCPERQAKQTVFAWLKPRILLWTGKDVRVSFVDIQEEGRRLEVDLPEPVGRAVVTVPPPTERWLRTLLTGRSDADDAEVLRRIYGKVRTLDVPLLPLFRDMPGPELQALLNRLLKGKHVEETMLAGFLQGHPELRDLFLANLSRNLRTEVGRLTGFDRLWVERTDLLFREILVRLWRDAPPSVPLWAELQEWMEVAAGRLCGDALEDGPFAALLLSPASEPFLTAMVVEIPSMTLAKAVAGLGAVQERLVSVMGTERKRRIFLEDVEAGERLPVREVRAARRSVFDDWHRRKVLAELSGFSPEKVRRAFEGKMLESGREELRLLAYELGVVRLSKAFLDLGPEVRRAVVARAGSVLGGLWRDLFAGRVRYKAVVSRQESEAVRFEALLCLSVWEEAGVVLRRAGT